MNILENKKKETLIRLRNSLIVLMNESAFSAKERDRNEATQKLFLEIEKNDVLLRSAILNFSEEVEKLKQSNHDNYWAFIGLIDKAIEK